MKLLELFCGTKSVGKAFEELGWEVTSFDIDPSCSPTIVGDILTFDYGLLEEGFDHVHASPPCTHYSRARTTAHTPRDLFGADEIVQKTLDIIARCLERNPRLTWTMENPQTGLLKTRDVVRGIPYHDVTYCKYVCENWNPGYKKATRIWGNLKWQPRSLCSLTSPCDMFVDGRHPATAQRRSSRVTDNVFAQRQLYSMPPLLCRDLAAAASQVNGPDHLH